MRCSFEEAFRRVSRILPNHPIQEIEQLLIAAIQGSDRVLRLSRIDLYFKSKEEFPSLAFNRLLEMAQERATGKPLQYITGTQYFLDHEFHVSPEVLIPRPETEILVTTATEIIQESRPSYRINGISPTLRGVEVGLGSGAISISLLTRIPGLNMAASEISEPAQKIAIQNAAEILGKKWNDILKIIQVSDSAEVLDPFLGSPDFAQMDFVISNPPYLSSADEIDSEVVAFEPHQALFAPEEDPLFFYRKIALQAQSVLKTNGWAFMEVPHERAIEILDLFSRQKIWDARLYPDLTGRDRVLSARLNGKEI